MPECDNALVSPRGGANENLRHSGTDLRAMPSDYSLSSPGSRRIDNRSSLIILPSFLHSSRVAGSASRAPQRTLPRAGNKSQAMGNRARVTNSRAFARPST